MRDADREAGGLARRLKEARRELERETEQRRKLRDQMQSFRSSVAGSFNNDPFGEGLAGFDLQLRADRNDARDMKAALRKAKRSGLDGGLFAALAASGDLNTAQAFAGLSRKEIAQRERLFRSTQQARGDLAGFATNVRFGKQMRELNREIKQLRQQIGRMGKHVEDGARRGVGDRDRRTAQRVRTGR